MNFWKQYFMIILSKCIHPLKVNIDVHVHRLIHDRCTCIHVHGQEDLHVWVYDIKKCSKMNIFTQEINNFQILL